MVAVGVRQLKANLSRYLKKARSGVDIEVMSRGRIVARVIGADVPRARSHDDALAELAQEGLAELPEAQKRIVKKRLVPGRGLPTSEIVRRQRR